MMHKTGFILWKSHVDGTMEGRLGHAMANDLKTPPAVRCDCKKGRSERNWCACVMQHLPVSASQKFIDK